MKFVYLAWALLATIGFAVYHNKYNKLHVEYGLMSGWYAAKLNMSVIRSPNVILPPVRMKGE